MKERSGTSRGEGWVEYFISPWCFPHLPFCWWSVVTVILMQGGVAILVSCPAETISGRMAESKDKLLNVTQKIFVTTEGVSQSICVKERKK